MERVGRFRILELLGRGGMGVVYKALDERLDRVVALKVLPESGHGQEERRERFMREARSAARVTHPSIVAIYEVGAADGRLFIAMELVAGQSLRDRLAGGPLPWAEATRIALDVASALEKAHESGIVHRDLKPDNVMLTGDGRAKVLDFGIAKLTPTLSAPSDATLPAPAAQITREGQLVGTPGYMSPEQALGLELDARSDLFSFGVVLYEMLAGRLPWVCKTPMDLVLSAARDAPTPLSELASVPPDLVELVNRCMERDVDRRVASAQEIVRRLTRTRELLERGEAPTDLALPMPAAPAPTKPDAPSPRARAFVIAVALVLVALVSAVLAGRKGADAPLLSASGAVAGDGNVTLATLEVQGCNPQATALMKSGYLAVRDAAWNKAIKLFEKAALADPACGAAHLRLAIHDEAALAKTVRERFQRAAELHERLSPRDAALVKVYEPTLARDPPAPSERRRRALAMLESYPKDAEVHAIAAYNESQEDPKRARQLIEQALELDPNYADAWQSLAVVRRLLGDREGALQALDRCIERSASTTDCVYERIRMGRANGAPCSAIEADARILVARESPSPNGHYYLALALAGQGERGAAEKALRERWQSLPEDRRSLIEARESAQLALHFGDFAEAAKLVRRLGEHPVGQAELAPRAHHALLAVDVALQTGRITEARAVIEASVRDLPAWSRPIEEMVPKVGFWFEAWLLGKRLEIGALEAPKGSELDRWRALDQTQRLPLFVKWAIGSGLPAVTPSLAKTALAGLPADARPESGEHAFMVNHAAGRTLLLAGRAREAEPFLRAASSRCDGFELPVIHAENQVLFGRSLEENGDKAGACATYRTLLDRWGAAKPPTKMAQAARMRSSKLGCESR